MPSNAILTIFYIEKAGTNLVKRVLLCAAINDSTKPFKRAVVQILEWEKTGEIKIINEKQEPTHVPFQKGQQQNCLDMMMITPGLEKKTRNYKLDIARGWTPARAEPTGEGTGPGKKYTHGQPSDHKAQQVTLMLDIFEKGKEGNRAIINYNNPEVWILYKTHSNFYAQDGY